MIDKETLKIAMSIIDFAREAATNGFLVLDKKCNPSDCIGNAFLELVLGFVVDGKSPEDIMQLTRNYTNSSGYTGELLEQSKIIVDGMLGIQAGISLEMLAEIICSHFDISNRNEFIDAVGVDIRKIG